MYDYKAWRRDILFRLRQYRQGLDGNNKTQWQQELALLRRARNKGLAQ